METLNDPFEAVALASEGELSESPTQRHVGNRPDAPVPAPAAVVTARLHGFAIDDSPIVAALPQLPGELVSARTAVPLRREQIGATVVVVFEGGDVHRPIVLGILQHTLPKRLHIGEDARGIAVHADGERYEVKAEREIVLRCGDASITLTRAGKVLIKGNYVLTRSTGANKIKGAVVDIN